MEGVIDIMVGLWILLLLAGIAWLNGWGWLVGSIVVVLIVTNIGVLLSLAGLSKYRHKKQKYHPA